MPNGLLRKQENYLDKQTFRGGEIIMECTTCMYEYVCNWAEDGHCDHYRPDLEQEEAEDDT